MKNFCIIASLIFLMMKFNNLNAAVVELEISRQAGRKIDTAMAPLKNSETQPQSSKGFETTVAFDLGQSGFFQMVKYPQEIAKISNQESSSSLSLGPQWKAIGADLVIKGDFASSGRGKTFEIYAFDVSSQQKVFAKRYSADSSDNIGLAAHQCANDIIFQMTGEKGIAGTRIAYVAGNSKSKELFVANSDGRGVRQLTQDGSIILGVSWHPSGTKILYTSFKDGMAGIYLHDFALGERRKLAAYPGLNAAAKFSPDGNRIALVLSKDGNPEIYVSDIYGRNLRRITNHPGVDSSPCWSPNGQKLAFVSNRSRYPHIYIQDLNGGPVRRVTHDGTYNSSPSWSPQGDKIAFSSNMDGGFKICVLDLASETITIVSQEGGEADEPDWAPDNRHILYSSKVGGVSQLYIVDSVDGKTIRLTSSSSMSYLTPAWSLS